MKREIHDALRIITDHIVPTREVTRSLSSNEIRAIRVLAVTLDEMSTRMRTGGVVNGPQDTHVGIWSGHVPISTTFGLPVSNADAGAKIPHAVMDLAGRDVHLERGGLPSSPVDRSRR